VKGTTTDLAIIFQPESGCHNNVNRQNMRIVGKRKQKPDSPVDVDAGDERE
jgi:hypothetical protein